MNTRAPSAPFSAAALLALLLPPPAFALASCDPISTFAEQRAPARAIHVSPAGSDTAGDGSLEQPFRGLARAAREARPGDAIRLLPGTHSGDAFVSGLAGAPDAPIWIGGAPGQPRPVIEGGGQAIHLSRVHYLVVENIEVRGARQNGINCDDGGERANADATRYVLFRNLFLHDIGSGGNQDALKLSGVNDYWVLDCTFERTSAGGSGIDHVGCHRGLIAGCSFTDMGSNAVQCKGGSAQIEIRWNRFVRGGLRAVNIGGSTGFDYFRPPLAAGTPNAEARDIRVMANLFVGADAPVAFVGAVDCVAANNTIVDPARWVLRILQETLSSGGYTFLPCGRNSFVNNLVSYSRATIGTHVNVGPNTDPGSFTFASNLWYAADQPDRSAPALPATETDPVIGQDPQFADPGSGDYCIPPASAAAGRGRAVPGLTADLHERCYADPPSIGACEASPPAHPAAARLELSARDRMRQ